MENASSCKIIMHIIFILSLLRYYYYRCTYEIYLREIVINLVQKVFSNIGKKFFQRAAQRQKKYLRKVLIIIFYYIGNVD